MVSFWMDPAAASVGFALLPQPLSFRERKTDLARGPGPEGRGRVSIKYYKDTEAVL